MQSLRWLSVAVLPVVLSSGCANMSHTDRGVLGGGAIGATTGALIGSATKNTGAGAAIGGIVGAVSGGLIGSAIDESEQKAVARTAAVASAQGPLGLTDIVHMTQNQISDAVIISKIRASGTVYNLSVNDINFLKANGVSDAVVMEMNATAMRAPRRVYTATPVYVVEPPPPPVRVGFGFGYGRCW